MNVGVDENVRRKRYAWRTRRLVHCSLYDHAQYRVEKDRLVILVVSYAQHHLDVSRRSKCITVVHKNLQIVQLTLAIKIISINKVKLQETFWPDRVHKNVQKCWQKISWTLEKNKNWETIPQLIVFWLLLFFFGLPGENVGWTRRHAEIQDEVKFYFFFFFFVIIVQVFGDFIFKLFCKFSRLEELVYAYIIIDVVDSMNLVQSWRGIRVGISRAGSPAS